MKLSIAVIFGGRTCEHEVSIISGLQAADVLNPESYDVTRVYIAADGEWYVGEKLKDIQFYKHFDPAQVTHVFPAGSKGKLRLSFLWVTGIPAAAGMAMAEDMPGISS